MSVKFQVTLPDRLAADLKVTAKRLKVPRAEFVRDCLEVRLREVKNRKRTDPLASIRGICDSDETDLSSRVDEIVYGTDPPEMKGILPPYIPRDRLRR